MGTTNINTNTKLHETRFPWKKLLIHLVLIAGIGITILPFFWMITTAFKTQGESVQMPPIWFPSQWRLDSFFEIWGKPTFVQAYLNTIISTVVTVIGQVGICALAAYSFARIKFPGRDILFVTVLGVLMIPSQIFLMPQYLIIQKLGLLNSIPALFLPNLFSAFGTFLLRQAFLTLPSELEEAAMLDGCNRFQTFYKIMLPLTKSSLVALSIMVMKFAWNDLMWPLIVNTSAKKMTLAPTLSSMISEYGSNYPVQMAGAVLSILPLVILFVIFQKQFIEGVASTGVKG
ncbi:MAG: carbohydrate ABC transporter permease [bacterium]|nr:carbohydrate ABC transporter permease [bacterium]